MSEAAIEVIRTGHLMVAHGLEMLNAGRPMRLKHEAKPDPEEVPPQTAVTLEFCQNLVELRNNVANVLATIDSQMAPCYAPGGPLDPG